MKWIALPNGTFRLLTPTELPIPISIADSDTNQPITIPQLAPNTAYKYLGVKLCADGSHTPHKTYLLQRSRRYAKAMQLCPLDRHGINIAYHSCYLPALTYSLPATSFSEDDLHDIQNEATSSFLSRLGFN